MTAARRREWIAAGVIVAFGCLFLLALATSSWSTGKSAPQSCADKYRQAGFSTLDAGRACGSYR